MLSEQIEVNFLNRRRCRNNSTGNQQAREKMNHWYKAVKIALMWSLVFMVPNQGAGQDAHYWTLQFGTRSTLLGGAVIGSVSDLGATFYNPARLGEFEDRGLLLSAEIHQYQSITVQDGVGEGIDLKESSFSAAPSLVAGTFKIGFLKGHHFAYSILTRQKANLKFVVGQTDSIDVIETTPGDELFAGEVKFNTNLDDLWAGLSWAYPFSKKFGIGITQYFSIRSQNNSFRFLAEALTTTGKTAGLIRIDEFDYKTYRTLSKLGLSLNLPRLTAGLTITTPSLHLAGGGSSLVNDLLTGGDLDGDGTSDDQLIGKIQNNLPAEYRSSWALGAGAAYDFGRARLHFSAEWFDAVGKYDLIKTSPFVGQSSGETVSNEIVQELSDVLNYGVGLELLLTEKFSGFASLVTDFAALDSTTGVVATPSRWDFYHFAVGTAFSAARSEIVLGMTYSFGNQRIARPLNLPVGSDEPMTGEETSKIRFLRIKFIFGFSFQF